MKTVVITGGNKGLGLAQTRKFLAEGWRTCVVARTQGEIASLTGDVHYIQADLVEGGADWLRDIHAEHGPIDALINNAGANLKQAVWETSPEDFQRLMDLNVKSLFAACGAYVDLHRNHGGAIVNLTSMTGLMSLPRTAAYGTAKTAVIGLTRSVAVDAAQFGIRCNAVAPGFIDTEMSRVAFGGDPERKARVTARIPGGAFGQPEDVANAVHFLASDQSAHINGVTLPVDGGFSIGF